jgi:hypothetical protein
MVAFMRAAVRGCKYDEHHFLAGIAYALQRGGAAMSGRRRDGAQFDEKAEKGSLGFQRSRAERASGKGHSWG